MNFDKQKQQRVIPTFVYVACPNCKKNRLLKKIGDNGSVEVVSKDTVTALTGDERYLDVCPACLSQYQKRDAQFMRNQVKTLQRDARNIDASTSDIEL
jgi:hypothetical protein